MDAVEKSLPSLSNKAMGLSRRPLHFTVARLRTACQALPKKAVRTTTPCSKNVTPPIIYTGSGFMPTFGDIPLWHILASCLIIPYISSYPCVTTLMRGRHGRSVAPETASMTEGARFHLDTSHDHPCPLITRCHAAVPRGLRDGRHHGADHPTRAINADPRPLFSVRYPTA